MGSTNIIIIYEPPQILYSIFYCAAVKAERQYDKGFHGVVITLHGYRKTSRQTLRLYKMKKQLAAVIILE